MTSSARSAATAAPSSARPWSASPTRAASCCICARRVAAIGLYAKLDAYALQDAGLDTYEANVALGHGEDERDYTVAAQMLNAIGVDGIRLLSNNPDKAVQLEALGIRVTERVPTEVHLSEANSRYLQAKRDHTAHTLDLSAA